MFTGSVTGHRAWRTSSSARSDRSTRAPANTRTTGVLRVGVRAGRLQGVVDRLTLNMGVRYEHSPPWHEVEGRIDVFRASRTTTPTSARRCSRTRLAAKRSAAMPACRRGRHRTAQPNNVGARVGFAWDITGDGRTSLRGGGGMFYDQHRDGESGNDAVNAPPLSLRLAVTRPAGPFSDPYRGRTDFDLINDEVDRHAAGAVPEAGPDLDIRRRVQDAADLQLQPHVRARGDRGSRWHAPPTSARATATAVSRSR